jgi:hypothetical protein
LFAFNVWVRGKHDTGHGVEGDSRGIDWEPAEFFGQNGVLSNERDCVSRKKRTRDRIGIMDGAIRRGHEQADARRAESCGDFFQHGSRERRFADGFRVVVDLQHGTQLPYGQ